MDWIAAALNIAGLWLLPKKRLWAMDVFVLSCVLWIMWGATIRAWSIVLLQCVLLVLNVRTIIIWRKQDATTTIV